MSTSKSVEQKLDCISHSETQTQRLGLRLGTLVKPGSVVLLEGTMGSGKTVFAQGVALGLEVKEHVTSPSYTLIKEYQSGKFPFYHIDLYRVGSDDSLWSLGLEEYLEGDGICVIEWPRKVRDFLPENWLLINIEIMTDTKRELHFESEGDRFQEVLYEYRRLAFGFLVNQV